MNYTCCGKTFGSAQAIGAHKRFVHPKGATTLQEGKLAGRPFSATLFSVIAGDVHIRGCEFNGGFLVVSGDTLQQHASLAEAIAAAQVTAKIPEAPKVEPETHSAY